MAQAPAAFRRFALVAADGTRLSAVWRSGPGSGATAALVLPGFWRRAESPRLADLADVLARRHDVISLDFRGHGDSGGRFTFGRDEHLDVAALLQAAAARGVRRAVLVGLSMGGAAAVAALARGAASGMPLEVAGAAVISSPARFGLIRPRPWRGGRRDVAWGEVLRVPRFDWRFPFTSKLEPEDSAQRLPAVPVRLLHARRDWLVDDALGRRLAERLPPPAEMLLLDVPGALHADELLGRARGIVLRLLEAWVDSALAPPRHADGAGRHLGAAPWRAGLAAHLAGEGRASADLGGALPRGEVGPLVAVDAGRDGAHLVFRVGDEACWARGLRDGSVHGLNLLGNALAADGPAWPAEVRGAVEAAGLEAGVRSPDGARPAVRVVRPRGDGGFAVS